MAHGCPECGLFRPHGTSRCSALIFDHRHSGGGRTLSNRVAEGTEYRFASGSFYGQRLVHAWCRCMTRTTAARLLVALMMCGAAAATCWAESGKPTKFRVSGAFCGTAWSGGSPQFAWLHTDSEINLMRPGKDTVVARASTDSSGRFQFSNIPRGTYHVGLVGFLDTNEMVEITSTDQRGCAQPLIVILYLQPFEGPGPESRIVAKLPPNFANATGEMSKERSAASNETSEGLASDHDLDVGERHFRGAIQIDPTSGWRTSTSRSY
jgi:hypothetical protein